MRVTAASPVARALATSSASVSNARRAEKWRSASAGAAAGTAVTGSMPAVSDPPPPRASVGYDADRYDRDMGVHRVACLAFEGLAPFEIGVAAEIFALPRPELEVDWWYEFALCAERPGPLGVVGGFAVVAPHGLEALARADTIVVPGVPDPRADPAPEVLGALRVAHARGARLLSNC